MEYTDPERALPACILLPTDEITHEDLEKSIRSFIELTGRTSFYAVTADSAWWDLDEWEIITDYDPNRFYRGGWIKGDGWIIRLIDADDPTIYVPPDVEEDYEAEPGLYIFPTGSRPQAN